MRSLRDTITVIACVTALSALCFGQALLTPFVWDDMELIVKNPQLGRAEGALNVWRPSYWRESLSPEDYRPFEMWSYSLDHLFWKKNPFGYHLSNLLLHIFNCIALYLLVLLLCRSRRTATVCCILFALHPMHSEAVIWAQNRSELLSLSLMLVSLIAFIRYTMGGSRPGISLALSLASFVLAALTKETALIMPLVCGAAAFFAGPVRRRRVRAFIITISLMACALLFSKFFLLRPERLERAIPVLTRGIMPHLFTVTKTVVYYLAMLLVPANFSLARYFTVPAMRPLTIPLLHTFLVLLLLAAALLALRRRHAAGLALILTLIALLPASNIFYIAGRPISEQRTYFASAGFCLVVASLAESVFLHGYRARWMALLCALVSLSYFTTTLARAGYWRNEQTLWERTLEVSPASWKAEVCLANIYTSQGRYDEAITLLKSVIRDYYPGPPLAYVDLGSVYEAMGRDTYAVPLYERAIALQSRFLEARLSLGDACLREGRWDEALDQYRYVELNWPRSGKGQFRSALVHKARGDHPAALGKLRQALALDPRAVRALALLASVYDEMGAHASAERYFKRALDIDPSSVAALNGLGLWHERRGEMDDARDCYEKASRAAPREPGPHYKLSRLYLRSGEKAPALMELMRAAQRSPGRLDYLAEITRLSHDLAGEQMPPPILDDIVHEHRALLNARGIHCARMGEHRAAMECFTKLVALSPRDGSAHANLGRIYLQEGRYDAALEEFSRATRLLPGEASVYSNIGLCYLMMGRREDAQRAWRRALAIDPKAKEPRRNLARLARER